MRRKEKTVWLTHPSHESSKLWITTGAFCDRFIRNLLTTNISFFIHYTTPVKLLCLLKKARKSNKEQKLQTSPNTCKESNMHNLVKTSKAAPANLSWNSLHKVLTQFKESQLPEIKFSHEEHREKGNRFHNYPNIPNAASPLELMLETVWRPSLRPNLSLLHLNRQRLLHYLEY